LRDLPGPATYMRCARPLSADALGSQLNQGIYRSVIQAVSGWRAWVMAGEFWLSEAQWGAIGPLLPKNQPGARRTVDRRVISGIVHVLKTGCRWQDCRASRGLRRRSTIAFAAGRCVGFGAACLTRWRAPSPAVVKPSTARGPRLTGRRQAEKGGGGAGDWPFARRPQHENPRHRRRARTPHRHRSDA
jgi:transposase